MDPNIRFISKNNMYKISLCLMLYSGRIFHDNLSNHHILEVIYRRKGIFSKTVFQAVQCV